MAYFGNTPLQSTYLTDYFSGNGSTTGFTLSRAPISSQAILVHISGVKQHASTYGVSGTTLTFSAAPPTGTNNIEVLHLGIQPETVTLPSYRTITETTATAGQTTFTPASYTVGYIDVYRNGVKLGAADFTASNGTSVVLNAACTAGDLVRFESFLITAFNNAIPNTAGAVGDSLIAAVSASKVSGVLTDSNMPAGSVLQVVSANTNSHWETTSTSYVDVTGLSASITPSSTSSKILVMYAISAGCNPNTAYFKVQRNGSDLYIGSGASINAVFVINGNVPTRYEVESLTYNYLDSPSSTSSLTYKIQAYVDSGTTLRVNGRGENNIYATTSSVVLMEIAG